MTSPSQNENMALKRTYQTSSKYTNPKRMRTLDTEVSKLKRQVNANKKELKYYDGYFTLPATPTYAEKSFITDVENATGTPTNPTFVGRKVHIRKMEIRVPDQRTETISENGAILIWRERRQGKSVLGANYPLALDPEYHTAIRHYNFDQDQDCNLKIFTIDFGKTGRLVEFDEQSTAVAQGAIVSGDIKHYWDNALGTSQMQFRVWYTDS